MAWNWGKPLAKSWRRTEGFSSIAPKELNRAMNHMRGSQSRSSVKSSDRTAMLADSLTAASWETLLQRTQLNSTWITHSRRTVREQTVIALECYLLGVFSLWSARWLIHTLISLWMWDKSYVLGINLTMIYCPFTHCLVWFTNIFCKDFCLGSWGNWFVFLLQYLCQLFFKVYYSLYTVSGFDIRNMLAS